MEDESFMSDYATSFVSDFFIVDPPMNDAEIIPVNLDFSNSKSRPHAPATRNAKSPLLNGPRRRILQISHLGSNPNDNDEKSKTSTNRTKKTDITSSPVKTMVKQIEGDLIDPHKYIKTRNKPPNGMLQKYNRDIVEESTKKSAESNQVSQEIAPKPYVPPQVEKAPTVHKVRPPDVRIHGSSEEEKDNNEEEYMSSGQEMEEEEEEIDGTNLIQITLDNINATVPQGKSACFYLDVQQNEESWHFIDSVSKTCILKIYKDSKIKNMRFIVVDATNEHNIIAIINSNLTRLTFFATYNFDEICAIDFKSQLTNNSQTRQFKGYITLDPSLFNNKTTNSLLIKRPQGAIVLKQKQPTIRNGIAVLNFGGKVKLESVKNFILMLDEENNDDGFNILSFGKAHIRQYVGDLHWPLSPLQALCLAIPHFK